MIECDKCLCGYHLQCLTPPLERVPAGEWQCPICLDPASERDIATGDAGHRKYLTARELFMTGKLDLTRIDRIWEETVRMKRIHMMWGA